MSSHPHHPPGPRRRFPDAYRFEILWVTAVALGIFLLLEKINVRGSLFAGLIGLSQGFSQGVAHIVLAISQTTISDAIAYLLLLGATVAAGWRLRWQLRRSPILTMLRCPHCGSELKRIRRRNSDRLISYLVPVRRYQCASRSCGWRGLRVAEAEVPNPTDLGHEDALPTPRE